MATEAPTRAPTTLAPTRAPTLRPTSAPTTVNEDWLVKHDVGTSGYSIAAATLSFSILATVVGAGILFAILTGGKRSVSTMFGLFYLILNVVAFGLMLGLYVGEGAGTYITGGESFVYDPFDLC